MIKKPQGDNIIISPEFKSLQRIISDEELLNLTNNILTEGVSNPLLIWNGMLVDGHKRYQICTKYNIPFHTKNMPFENSLEVMDWICDSNLANPNISEEYQKYYIGKKYSIRTKINKALYEENVISNNKGPNRIENAHEVSSIFNISYATVLKYSAYSNAIDIIRKKEPKIVEVILLGKTSVSHKNVLELSRLSYDDLKLLTNYISDNSKNRITYQELWTELRWNRACSKTLVNNIKTPDIAPIKIMPKYNPDAELSRLSLTIPSWINSIERTFDSANLQSTSDFARNTLIKKLRELSETSELLQAYLLEVTNERK